MMSYHFICHPRAGGGPIWLNKNGMPAFAGMTRKVMLLIILFLLSWINAAYAVQPDEMLNNIELEARARVISKELRCLVCQNESIDDSDAPLAHDLRVILRQRLMAGDTDEQAKQYLVARYGDYVLLKPPFRESTLALWLGPLLIFIGAMGGAAMFYRRRRTEEEPALSAKEELQVAVLMDELHRGDDP